MASFIYPLLAASLAQAAPGRPCHSPPGHHPSNSCPSGPGHNVVYVAASPGSNAGVPMEAFVSFSIEFSSFPDFAGNLSNPNSFTDNLLNNLGNLTGTKPYLRVGGNTQDFAIFDTSLDVGIVGIVQSDVSPDYPTDITIGPAYFESYQTLPNTRFIHGFDQGQNSSEARQALIDSVPYACNALQDGKLAYWEFGNEADLFRRNGTAQKRPVDWTIEEYTAEWVYWTRRIQEAMERSCPELATRQYYAPSFAGTGDSGFDPVLAFADGLDADHRIGVISDHNYVSGAMVPGVTLQGTLMNHTANIETIRPHLNESRYLYALPDDQVPPQLPFIMGETNSLYNQGRPGLSNTFGAALWGVDFNLWCAYNNISRVHMHQGTNYRYQSWQPIETDLASKGTKAPYYGNIAVAAFMGDIAVSAPQIANLPLPRETESAYAAYVDGRLARIMVINMDSYNNTDYNSNYTNGYPRPVEQYKFQLPPGCGKHVEMQRLLANGSDAITGITFDGYSYNYELDNGMPVLLNNVTRGETARIRHGYLNVGVPRSSAVILKFSE